MQQLPLEIMKTGNVRPFPLVEDTATIKDQIRVVVEFALRLLATPF